MQLETIIGRRYYSTSDFMNRQSYHKGAPRRMRSVRATLPTLSTLQDPTNKYTDVLATRVSAELERRKLCGVDCLMWGRGSSDKC